MSARHRHHKRRIREVEGELEENGEEQAAVKRVMAMLTVGNDTNGRAYFTLDRLLAELVRDREALLEIMAVLAPDDWRWRISERWREARNAHE